MLLEGMHIARPISCQSLINEHLFIKVYDNHQVVKECHMIQKLKQTVKITQKYQKVTNVLSQERIFLKRLDVS